MESTYKNIKTEELNKKILKEEKFLSRLRVFRLRICNNANTYSFKEFEHMIIQNNKLQRRSKLRIVYYEQSKSHLE